MKLKAYFLKIKDTICSFYKKNKKLFISCVICLIIMDALVISTFSDLKKTKSNTTKSDTTVSVSDFASEVETKLTNLILKLDNISSVSVFVMVDSTPTVTYLTESTEKTETKDGSSISETTTTVVFEKNGSISSPIVVTTIMPKVTGVLIVTNKINASTKLSIINSVSIVLNIDESCISLLQES